MRILSVLAALLVGLVALAPSSHAATVTYDVSFSANNFFGVGTPPVSSVSGGFEITFDPTQTYLNDGSVITNFTIDLPGFSASPVFSYTPALFGSGAIGGAPGGALGLQGTDFNLGFTLAGLVTEFSYEALKNGHWRTYTALFPTVKIAAVTPATTPIPASLVMLLTALGLLGGVAYLRRKVQPQAAMIAA